MSRKTPTVVGYTENGHVLLSLQRIAKKANLSKNDAELIGLSWPHPDNWREALLDMAVPLPVFKSLLLAKVSGREETELLAALSKVAECNAGEWFKISLEHAKVQLDQVS